MIGKRVQCEISELFKKYRFKTSRYTYVLYHNVDYKELLRIIRENAEDFKF